MSELKLLKLRNLIADKEFNTAAGNRELANSGGWDCDRYYINRNLSNQIDDLTKELDAEVPE